MPTYFIIATPNSLNTSDVTSFSVVSNPYERLISAYKDKVDPSKYSFNQFLEFILLQAEECPDHLQCMDMHWRPQTFTCSYCQFPFKVISTMETFDMDRRVILEMAGLPLGTGDNHIHVSKEKSKDLIKSYFQNVSTDILRNVEHLYKYDFEMFDYDMNMD